MSSILTRTRTDSSERMALAGLLILALGVGCQQPEPEPVPPEEVVSSAAVAMVAAREASGTEAEIPANGSGLDDNSLVEEAVRSAMGQLANDDPKKNDKKEDGDEEEDVDYWEDVRFDDTNFDEVVNFVREQYIDDKVNYDRAYAEACVYLMLSLETPYQVVPAAFYKARKGHENEEGGLDGEARSLKKGLAVKAVKLVEKEEEEEEKPRKRLSDDEIRDLREKSRARTKLLNETWNQVGFSRGHFETCMARAKEWGAADKKEEKKDLDKRLWLGAAQGFLRALDPHSSIVSRKAWEDSTRRTTDDSFEGIGAILTKRDDFIIVESPIEGRPAYRAGLRAGDQIIKVDEKTVVGMELQPVVKRIRGERNTKVVLTVRREGEPEDITIPIIRDHIDIKNVRSSFVKEHSNLGYIKLTGFVPSSAAKIKEAYQQLKADSNGNLRGVVFDLRNNSGGLLKQAVEISDFFLESGIIVSVKNRMGRGSSADDVQRALPSQLVDVPVVVLVNDASASASEIVAGAIQDNKRGLVLGERTFGKASVQTLFNPRRGQDYYIKLTVARYYAPSGRTIQVIGIHPDLEVGPDVDKPMPLGFREENLSNHLTALDSSYESPNADLLGELGPCVKKRGIAEKIHQADPNPQIRFDYQLMKAADYLECMIDREARAKAARR